MPAPPAPQADPYVLLWLREGFKARGRLQRTRDRGTALLTAEPACTCPPAACPPPWPAPQYRTATRSRTLTPVWQESFTLLVHSTAHQELQLALYDSGGRVGGWVVGGGWWVVGGCVGWVREW